MGRQPKPKENQITRRISIGVTEQEKGDLETLAYMRGVTLTTLAREIIAQYAAANHATAESYRKQLDKEEKTLSSLSFWQAAKAANKNAKWRSMVDGLGQEK